MKIRKAKLKDANQIYKLMIKNKELENSVNYFNKNFLNILIKEKNFLLVICKEKNKIIGLLGSILFEKRSTAYLDSIFLDKKFRGRGFGRILYEYYIDYLKKNNIKYFWTFIENNDYTLQEINKHFGMKKRGLYYMYDKNLK